MWKVKINDEAAWIFENDDLTEEDKIIIQKWAETVERLGPEGLGKRSSIWADHPLYGVWKGYRSSRFSFRGRIIYKVEEGAKTVIVVRITTRHDYKR